MYLEMSVGCEEEAVFGGAFGDKIQRRLCLCGEESDGG